MLCLPLYRGILLRSGEFYQSWLWFLPRIATQVVLCNTFSFWSPFYGKTWRVRRGGDQRCWAQSKGYIEMRTLCYLLMIKGEGCVTIFFFLFFLLLLRAWSFRGQDLRVKNSPYPDILYGFFCMSLLVADCSIYWKSSLLRDRKRKLMNRCRKSLLKRCTILW